MLARADEKPLAYLGVGIAIGMSMLTLGAFVVFLLRERKTLLELTRSNLGLGVPAVPPVRDIPQLASPGQPIVKESAPRRNAARTVTATSTQTMIMRAQGSQNWEVKVRVVSPPGGQVTFAGGNNPSEGITINAGESEKMWLSPDEDLYVQVSAASVSPTVIVSASGGEE